MSKRRPGVYYRPMSNSGALYSTAEAASVLGVSRRHVHRWATDGTLPPVKRLTGLTGALLFAVEDVNALAAQRAGRHRAA